MIGQNMIVTSGMDEGREVLVVSESDGVMYCESVDGETLESGGNVLTEFGFDSERLEPADPNKLFQGMHIVVLGETESGKKNINKYAKIGMKGIILKLNDKRSQIKLLETGQETLLGNNLMKRDETYVAPKPIVIKRGNIVVAEKADGKFTGKVVSVTSKKFTALCVMDSGLTDNKSFDRFDVVKVITVKDMCRNIITDNKTSEKKEIQNKIDALKEVRRDLFSKFDVDTAEELGYSIEVQREDLREELNRIKPERKFKDTDVVLTKKEKLSETFIRFIQERRKKVNVGTECIRYMGAMVKRQGNVYTEPNQIKKFKSVNKHDVVQMYKTPNTSDDYVGIEIECLVNVSRGELDNLLIKDNLHFNCKLVDDMSIRKDNDSNDMRAIEVTFMAKRSNYKVNLKKLTDLISSVGGRVNESCGLHVHFDMRNKDPRVMYNRLYKTQDMLMKMVSKERRGNQYCQPSLQDYDRQFELHKKYSNINLATLDKHNTIEVRLHDGTCDYDDITNWIEVLYSIQDNKKFVSKTSSTASMVRQLRLTAQQKRYVLNSIKKNA